MKQVVFTIAMVLILGCSNGSPTNSPTAVTPDQSGGTASSLAGVWSGTSTVVKAEAAQEWPCASQVPSAGFSRRFDLQIGGSSDSKLSLTVDGDWAGSSINLHGQLADDGRLTASLGKGRFLEIEDGCGVHISLRAQRYDNVLTGTWKSTLHKASSSSYEYDADPVGEVDETFEVSLIK